MKINDENQMKSMMKINNDNQYKKIVTPKYAFWARAPGLI